MLNLQTLLQKKKGQNTAENNHCAKRMRKKRTAMLSMAAVGMIPFLAPPVGTDSSVLALAAAAANIDGLFGQEESDVPDALIAAAVMENEEAAKAIRAASEGKNAFMDSYRAAAAYTTQTWKGISQGIRQDLLHDFEDELLLLGLDGEDKLSESDVVIDAGVFGASIEKEDGTEGAPANGSGTDAGGADQTDAAAAQRPDKALAGAGKMLQEAGSKKGKAVAETENAPVADESLQQEDKKNENAAEAFLAKLGADIPAGLSVKYNAGYAALKLPAEQLRVLETIVEAEAGDEDVYGKILVANVVLNRVIGEEFPDTVKEVVFQSNGKTYQFSPVRKGGRYYTVKVSEHTRTAVARALAGEDYSDGALYFFARRYTSAKKANWFDTSLRKIVEYGCHEFFGNK